MDWKDWLNTAFQTHVHQNSEVLAASETQASETQGGQKARKENEKRKGKENQGNIKSSLKLG